MRRSSALGRFALLVLVVLGVLLMHHVPIGHGGAHPTASAGSGHLPAAAQHDHDSGTSTGAPPDAARAGHSDRPGATTTAHRAHPESAPPRPATGHRQHPASPIGGAADHRALVQEDGESPMLGAVPEPGHDPLHLCLAVLAGFAALLLPSLGRALQPLAAATAPAQPIARSRPRAPPSHSRRLAVLCVLRR